MKCAKDNLGVKIAQPNINLYLSIKMNTGSNQIDVFFLLCCVVRCYLWFILSLDTIIKFSTIVEVV